MARIPTDLEVLRTWRRLNNYRRNEIPRDEYETLELINVARMLEGERIMKENV